MEAHHSGLPRLEGAAPAAPGGYRQDGCEQIDFGVTQRRAKAAARERGPPPERGAPDAAPYPHGVARWEGAAPAAPGGYRQDGCEEIDFGVTQRRAKAAARERGPPRERGLPRERGAPGASPDPHGVARLEGAAPAAPGGHRQDGCEQIDFGVTQRRAKAAARERGPPRERGLPREHGAPDAAPYPHGVARLEGAAPAAPGGHRQDGCEDIDLCDSERRAKAAARERGPPRDAVLQAHRAEVSASPEPPRVRGGGERQRARELATMKSPVPGQQKARDKRAFCCLGTGDRTRTYTTSLPVDFESTASTIPPHRHGLAAHDSEYDPFRPCPRGIQARRNRSVGRASICRLIPRRAHHEPARCDCGCRRNRPPDR